MELIGNNQDKRVTYAILSTKLKKAIANEFYFEASLIEYAIIEDRLSSILLHAKVKKEANIAKASITEKIKSIRAQIEGKHIVISKKMKSDILDEICAWKDERNIIVHNACKYKYDELAIKEIALKGAEIVKKITSDSVKVTRLSKKVYGEGE